MFRLLCCCIGKRRKRKRARAKPKVLRVPMLPPQQPKPNPIKKTRSVYSPFESIKEGNRQEVYYCSERYFPHQTLRQDEVSESMLENRQQFLAERDQLYNQLVGSINDLRQRNKVTQRISLSSALSTDAKKIWACLVETKHGFVAAPNNSVRLPKASNIRDLGCLTYYTPRVKEFSQLPRAAIRFWSNNGGFLAATNDFKPFPQRYETYAPYKTEANVVFNVSRNGFKNQLVNRSVRSVGLHADLVTSDTSDKSLICLVAIFNFAVRAVPELTDAESCNTKLLEMDEDARFKLDAAVELHQKHLTAVAHVNQLTEESNKEQLASACTEENATLVKQLTEESNKEQLASACTEENATLVKQLTEKNNKEQLASERVAKAAALVKQLTEEGSKVQLISARTVAAMLLEELEWKRKEAVQLSFALQWHRQSANLRTNYCLQKYELAPWSEYSESIGRRKDRIYSDMVFLINKERKANNSFALDQDLCEAAKLLFQSLFHLPDGFVAVPNNLITVVEKNKAKSIGCLTYYSPRTIANYVAPAAVQFWLGNGRSMRNKNQNMNSFQPFPSWRECYTIPDSGAAKLFAASHQGFRNRLLSAPDNAIGLYVDVVKSDSTKQCLTCVVATFNTKDKAPQLTHAEKQNPELMELSRKVTDWWQRREEDICHQRRVEKGTDWDERPDRIQLEPEENWVMAVRAEVVLQRARIANRDRRTVVQVQEDEPRSPSSRISLRSGSV